MVALSYDKAGETLSEVTRQYFIRNNIEFKDIGSFVDYPDAAEAVSAEVLSGTSEKGVIICGTGIGVSMMANRHKGIRAAVCGDTFSARAARLHNNANVLTMGARVVGVGLAEEILQAFFSTEASDEERHLRRVSMLDK